jgi:predicted MPP superfamily phosphohydrolase
MIFISLFAFLVLVIFGHYFAWQLCLEACPRLRSRRFYLLAVFIIFTLFFLGAFMILHRSDNTILAYFYVLSAIFFGLLSQLMLFGLLFWVTRLISQKLVYLKKRPLLLPRLFVMTALVFFVFGSYNAFYPQVKTIKLKGWSEELKGKSFVQLSDLHLGAVYRPFWLEQIVRQTNTLNPNFVIISGDLFDGSDETLEEFIPALKNFSAPTIFVPGNHDYYLPTGLATETASSGTLIILSDAAQEISGLEIIGFNYLAREDSSLRREIKDLRVEADLTRIVVNHVPVDRAEAKNLGAKLLLSGHTHRGQIFPFSAFVRLLYGPFSYGLEDYEGMMTNTSSGTGTWGPPLRTLFPGEIIKFVIE